DASKVHRELATRFFEEMREQKAHFKERKRKFPGPHHRIPGSWRRWHQRWSGNVLVKSIGRDASDRSHRAYQDSEKFQGACDLPSSKITGCCVTPDMRCNRGAGAADFPRDLDDLGGGDTRLLRRELWRELSVHTLENLDEMIEGLRFSRKFGAQVFFP